MVRIFRGSCPSWLQRRNDWQKNSRICLWITRLVSTEGWSHIPLIWTQININSCWVCKVKCDFKNNHTKVLTSDWKDVKSFLNVLWLKLCVFDLVASTMSNLKMGVTEKRGSCMKLRDQLDALEKETAAKLAQMDQYNKDMQVGVNEWHLSL